jgi:DNA-binding FadR family transcriptional regulator
MLVHLAFAQARFEDVLEARLAVEVAAARIAARRRPVRLMSGLHRDAQQLSSSSPDWSREAAFHRSVAVATGNPAFEVFTEILFAVARRFNTLARPTASWTRGAHRKAGDAHAGIVRAIDRGDESQAARAMAVHLEEVLALHSPRRLHHTLGVGEVLGGLDRPRSIAESISRDVYAGVVARGWPVGAYLGSESELIVQHGASRSVVREALRLLELDGIVTTKRGPGGGVFVSAPDEAPTVAAMAMLLASRRATESDVEEVRASVQSTSVALAVEPADDCSLSAPFERSAADARNDDPPSSGLDIAEITGNPVLWLFWAALAWREDRRDVMGPARLDVRTTASEVL